MIIVFLGFMSQKYKFLFNSLAYSKKKFIFAALIFSKSQ